MARRVLDDNNVTGTQAEAVKPDPHGQAALLLVESLIHALIAQAVVSVEDAIEIVKVAAEAEIEIDAEVDELSDRRSAATLLNAIKDSLSLDLPKRL